MELLRAWKRSKDTLKAMFETPTHQQTEAPDLG
jgi:hypothetical protein